MLSRRGRAGQGQRDFGGINLVWIGNGDKRIMVWSLFVNRLASAGLDQSDLIILICERKV
ncbi:MAG: hypothetical protein CYG59_07165 [Chloroflexi bacterium]|nr:MAG: hypothetical protein CYG59_07165 [Chloroflexota bacterium]